MATIADNFDDVSAFLQDVAVKSPRFVAAQLSLRADNHARVWFCRWTDINLPTPPKPAPQDHMDITGVLTDVATRLHTAEALRPVVAAHCEAEKETKGWDHLPPKAQHVILAASATNETFIPTSLPPTIQCFLNASNATALEAYFSNLCRGKYLLTHLLLSGPPPRAHTGHPRPGRTDGIFASHNPSIFHRTRELPSAGNEKPSPPVHEKGSPIKKRSGRATGP